MSDFMKEVVGQILSPKQANPSTDEGDRSIFQREITDSLSNESIKRPNYQLENKTKRLSMTANEQASPVSKNSQINQPNVTVIPNSHSSNALSKLQTMSLTKGEAYNQKANASGYAEMIGKANTGAGAWFFPKLSKGLEKFFYRTPQQGVSAGCVNFPECYPSQLMFVNNIIRENQEVKYHLEWDKKNKGEFLLEMFYEDEHWLKNTLKQLFQKINRNTMKHYEVFKIDYPSTWLSKQLGINYTVEGLCFVEGLPYYSNISLLDHVLKAMPEGTLNYHVENEYLLVSGSQNEMTEAEAVFKKNGGQFIG
ncbi:hypothetical protein HUG15_17540 [Salicibibacter cibarius]|uniref:Uncharacterized protein n=1 Tax=Salicibibacter cibarius TaxID=2743000 RepID=A0A7T6Z568_9BACI|nr:hypothetical protein [Salicibibacter cibarius]QQK77203.1 hypothetical protein HUG15_17540 [Salicibibacter cibarius]